jgi:hypothetical protein
MLTQTASGYTFPISCPIAPAYVQSFTAGVLELLESIEREAAGQVSLVHSGAVLLSNLHAQRLSLVLYIEEGEAIAADLSNLEAWDAQGCGRWALSGAAPTSLAALAPPTHPPRSLSYSGLRRDQPTSSRRYSPPA